MQVLNNIPLALKKKDIVFIFTYNIDQAYTLSLFLFYLPLTTHDTQERADVLQRVSRIFNDECKKCCDCQSTPFRPPGQICRGNFRGLQDEGNSDTHTLISFIPGLF